MSSIAWRPFGSKRSTTFRDNPRATPGSCSEIRPAGPNISLQARDKRAPSRRWLHLDLYTDNAPAEVERLMSLGAERYPWRYRPQSDFTVLADPDGNLFCVVQRPPQV